MRIQIGLKTQFWSSELVIYNQKICWCQKVSLTVSHACILIQYNHLVLRPTYIDYKTMLRTLNRPQRMHIKYVNTFKGFIDSVNIETYV